eukprot:CAMPEP_0184349148 /NCGR_PEP_ID=MMETSP1089-20130417/32201_1 /TAXON_ID=38269 ORGANISM="Gloeochaete wittrockiana, Strain SAG46.84" /NCGR_SAMPLE_ID=MMETSP1089 /ASSEMBLY_ACC=CAM_ASM_000445 /LENGTH=147 /DNA_ID=CAMNT_0026681229 /DNA_START=12 /DNA_END=452 /DNA_ORIENTATION=+
MNAFLQATFSPFQHVRGLESHHGFRDARSRLCNYGFRERHSLGLGRMSFEVQPRRLVVFMEKTGFTNKKKSKPVKQDVSSTKRSPAKPMKQDTRPEWIRSIDPKILANLDKFLIAAFSLALLVIISDGILIGVDAVVRALNWVEPEW